MNEQHEIDKFRDILEVFCLKDQDSIRLCEDYLYVTHVWDDLFDQDKERSIGEINQAFCKALAHIPMNPVYQDNVKELSALSLIAALTWQIANRFEKSQNPDELLGSFILRNSLMNLIYFIVLATGARAEDDAWGIDMGEQFFKDMFEGFHGKYLRFLSEMRLKNESNNESDLRHRDRQANC